jgi:amidophosphoribosyltransferase
MCGIIGIVGRNEVAASLYDALTVLQHRGQDAAGIATADGGRIRVHKGNGLVKDVFTEQDIRLLTGRVGIGHCRYPTAGSEGFDEAQPFYVNSPYGIALAHNGNLINTEDLRRQVFETDRRNVNTESDSEVLLNVFAHELAAQPTLNPQAAIAAVAGVHRRCIGGYAAVSMVLGLGVVAFRDPHGIRPLVLGQRQTAEGTEYAVASESVALDLLGYARVRDVRPGECVVITARGELFGEVCATPGRHSPCIFEFVYLARPDSMMEDVSVHKARMRMGIKLGEKIQRLRPDHDIDTVIPIPDTSRTSALELANVLGVKYREGFIKNRYIGRTFIMPGQSQRRKSVRQKLNVIELEFKGKNVLLVDDSIVRGTTIQQIIQMAREAGARKVYMASAAPPVRYPNVYGIDMPTPSEFVAHNRTDEQVARIIGTDMLIYQRLEDLVMSAREGNPAISRFECSVFDGKYVTGDIDDAYLERLSLHRSDEMKQRRDAELPSDQTVIDLYNHA